MTYKARALFLTKIIGVWLIVKGLLGIPQIFAFIDAIYQANFQFDVWQNIISPASVFFLCLVLGIALLLLPATSIRKLARDNLKQFSSPEDDSRSFFVVCLTLLGVLQFTGFLTGLAWQISRFIFAYDNNIALFHNPTYLDLKINIVTLVFQLVISLILIFKSGLVEKKLYNKLWKVPDSKLNSDDESKRL
jgi:hypothetical protein